MRQGPSKPRRRSRQPRPKHRQRQARAAAHRRAASRAARAAGSRAADRNMFLEGEKIEVLGEEEDGFPASFSRGIVASVKDGQLTVQYEDVSSPSAMRLARHGVLRASVWAARGASGPPCPRQRAALANNLPAARAVHRGGRRHAPVRGVSRRIAARAAGAAGRAQVHRLEPGQGKRDDDARRARAAAAMGAASERGRASYVQNHPARSGCRTARGGGASRPGCGGPPRAANQQAVQGCWLPGAARR
jgi:hypothetical protein